ncbi:hypothetical protein [Borrelia venezuelensis]|uniref:hypothetical protein n=1 Tax=Borrelia venezuelensis TaxID=1653839 RepID=UPI001FF65630|nr:hypothetical protein [Borrelia venezuelensis]UPA12631.1 hypothetical protein bvRMA01_000963 [Borrelia venezuelensis]
MNPEKKSFKDNGYGLSYSTMFADNNFLRSSVNRKALSTRPSRSNLLKILRDSNLTCSVSDIASMLDRHKTFVKHKKELFEVETNVEKKRVNFPLNKMSSLVDSLATYHNILTALQYEVQPAYILMDLLYMLNLDDPSSRNLKSINSFLSMLDRMSDLTTKVVYEDLTKSRLKLFSQDEATIAVIFWTLERFLKGWNLIGTTVIKILYEIKNKLDQVDLRFSDKKDILNMLMNHFDLKELRLIASNIYSMERYVSFISELLAGKFFADD